MSRSGRSERYIPDKQSAHSRICPDVDMLDDSERLTHNTDDLQTKAQMNGPVIVAAVAGIDYCGRTEQLPSQPQTSEEGTILGRPSLDRLERVSTQDGILGRLQSS